MWYSNDDIQDRLDFLRFLLEKDAGKDSCSSPTIFTTSKATILNMIDWPSATIDLVRFLVEEARAEVNVGDPCTLTPLQAAVFAIEGIDRSIRKCLDNAKYLLSVGAHVDGWQKPRGVDCDLLHRALGFTALQGAVKAGNIDAIRILLQNGANPNQPIFVSEYAPHGYNGTALESAAEEGYLDIVQLLLNAGAEDLEFASEIAEKRDHFAVADLLKSEMRKRN